MGNDVELIAITLALASWQELTIEAQRHHAKAETLAADETKPPNVRDARIAAVDRQSRALEALGRALATAERIHPRYRTLEDQLQAMLSKTLFDYVHLQEAAGRGIVAEITRDLWAIASGPSGPFPQLKGEVAQPALGATAKRETPLDEGPLPGMFSTT